MSTKELEYIKLKKRWPLKLDDILFRFSFLFFPLAFLFIGVITLFSGFKNDFESLNIPGFMMTLIGIFFVFFVVKRLFENQLFQSHTIENLTTEKITNALKETNLLNSKYYKLGYFSAMTKTSWFSWGEEITIIQDNNQLLINSRATGFYFINQPITILKDKKNIEIIINKLIQQENL